VTPTFVLIHGAGGSSWSWHLVDAELRRRGYDDIVAVDLPCDDDSAGLAEYLDAALAAIGSRAGRSDPVVVAHSLGGYTGALVCDRVPAALLLYVSAMIPAPGESPGDWWTNTGFMEARAAELERLGGDDSPETTFTHDLPRALAAEAGVHIRDQSGTPMEQPFPLDAMPDVPTRFLVCRADRFFPEAFMRRVVADRLGLADTDAIDAGHLPMLSRPVELVDWVETGLAGVAAASRNDR
jgi:pimeloyl-ACP methyl ester carboxylesterase